jgi:hypothetical protein
MACHGNQRSRAYWHGNKRDLPALVLGPRSEGRRPVPPLESGPTVEAGQAYGTLIIECSEMDLYGQNLTTHQKR